MKTWRKNLVAAAVLVTVCAGIYVNWLYTEDLATAELTSTLDEQKLMSQDMLVMSGEEGVLLGEETTTTDYFAAVRLARQQARDSAVTMLQEVMAYSDNIDTKESSSQLEQIVQTALCEAQIESLVIAKGYTDCVAYISDEGISVAVAAPEGGLKQEDVAVIADIVIAQSDFEMGNIRVVEVP
jgi:stage III sporulation protein AH